MMKMTVGMQGTVIHRYFPMSADGHIVVAVGKASHVGHIASGIAVGACIAESFGPELGSVGNFGPELESVESFGPELDSIGNFVPELDNIVVPDMTAEVLQLSRWKMLLYVTPQVHLDGDLRVLPRFRLLLPPFCPLAHLCGVASRFHPDLGTLCRYSSSVVYFPLLQAKCR